MKVCSPLSDDSVTFTELNQHDSGNDVYILKTIPTCYVMKKSLEFVVLFPVYCIKPDHNVSLESKRHHKNIHRAVVNSV